MYIQQTFNNAYLTCSYHHALYHCCNVTEIEITKNEKVLQQFIKNKTLLPVHHCYSIK